MIVIPEPVSRNSFPGHVSRKQRMKPWTKGVQARQKFIVRKHRLLAQGGEGTQISQEGTQMGCHGSILLFSLISAKSPLLVYLSPSDWLNNNFKFYQAFSLHFFCNILFCIWRQTSLSHDILFFWHLFFCKTKISASSNSHVHASSFFHPLLCLPLLFLAPLSPPSN